MQQRNNSFDSQTHSEANLRRSNNISVLALGGSIFVTRFWIDNCSKYYVCLSLIIFYYILLCYTVLYYAIQCSVMYCIILSVIIYFWIIYIQFYHRQTDATLSLSIGHIFNGRFKLWQMVNPPLALLASFMFVFDIYILPAYVGLSTKHTDFSIDHRWMNAWICSKCYVCLSVIILCLRLWQTKCWQIKYPVNFTNSTIAFI